MKIGVQPTSAAGWEPALGGRRSWRARLEHLGGGRSRIGAVFAGMGAGLLVQALGDHLGRTDVGSFPQALFVIGVVTIFAAAATRLLSDVASERERVQVVALLGIALLVSSRLFDPTLFSGFDDLLHQTTLWQLQAQHALFTHNTVLPVSPYYPGLELVTIGIRDATGAPSVVAELLVVALARLILVLSLFRIAQRLLGTPRAAGAAVLVYAASPQFYGFNASYSYQTLALAFAGAAVCLLLAAIEHPRPGIDARVVVADFALLAVVITHHLVGAITVIGLIGWTLLASKRIEAASRRVLVQATLLVTVAFAAWTAVAAGVIVPYLRPILAGAVTGLVQILTHFSKRRTILHSAGGIATPTWETLLLLVSVAIFLVGLVAIALERLRQPVQQRGWRLGPTLIVVAYVLDLASALSANAAQVGQRASTFLFFPIALVFGRSIDRRRGRVPQRVAIGLVLTVAFAGSLVLGAGPLWDDVPGPYVPVSDQRAVDAPAIQAARWAAANLPVNATIAADRDNGALMAAIGHLAPVTAFSGGVNVGPLYFDRTFGTYDRSLIARAHIDYLLVDTRLAAGPPAFGAYFEPGETQARERLDLGQLTKFAAVPGFRAIYRNGPITIYSLAGLGEVPVRSAPVPTTPVNAGGLFILGCGLFVVSRRRRGDSSLEAGERLITWLVASGTALLCLGLAVTLLDLSPLAIELAAGIVATAWALWALFRPLPRPTERAGWTGIGLWLTGALAAVIAISSCAAASAAPPAAPVRQASAARPAAITAPRSGADPLTIPSNGAVARALVGSEAVARGLSVSAARGPKGGT